MFYSRTLLARKTPPGTVWMAAHLHHKLRKSDVSFADISTSIYCIMFPEVPIALRLTAYLLLGVVRIYSKKVDYLYHDCNMFLTQMRTIFTSIQVNLPEDATHAPFHAVTLPETFELDALDLNDVMHLPETPDNHLKTPEQITITEQIPGEGNPYVAFFIDEDMGMGISPQTGPSNLRFDPMEEDVYPTHLEDSVVGVKDPGPSNHAEGSNDPNHYADHFPEGLPDMEILRDAVQPSGSENPLEFLDFGKDVEQHQPYVQITIDKENLSPIIEELSVSEGASLLSRPNPISPTIRSVGEPESSGSRVSLGPVSPEMLLQPSPPVEEQRPNPRKRKQLFDKCLVLTNEFMKKQLQDASMLLRKRRKLPCSTLQVWKSHTSSRMEQIFFDPSISGICTNLQEILKKGFLASKFDPIPTETLPEPQHAQVDNCIPEFTLTEAQLAQLPAGMPAYAMEIEHPRFVEAQVDNGVPEFRPSQLRREEYTPTTTNLGSVSQTEKFQETEILLTPGMPASTEPVDLERETPLAFLGEQVSIGDTSLPEIPEMLNSPLTEELSFLEADGTQAGHGENEVNTLSVRTRAVAQYLKRKSPETQISKAQSGNLSLNRILEGKARKQCARMFFETLVLKNYGLINVQQEEAYGDITISLTSALSKAKF
ncbi:sister chromatid cohesion 1 protein 3-like [Tasmannia lanceolata]|uniref:sister chromatid cohesion 1 protein 3-like n=1 Tax=Tasmannia lanceolata TaxID=3420 RepID=UPI00406368B1